MQLVLFAYVFGAVANIGHGIKYKDFVVPAVLVQTMTFAAISHVHLGTAAWHFAVWRVIVVAFTALAVRRYRLG
jgi:hypothetical protein